MPIIGEFLRQYPASRDSGPLGVILVMLRRAADDSSVLRERCAAPVAGIDEFQARLHGRAEFDAPLGVDAQYVLHAQFLRQLRLLRAGDG